MAVLKTKGFTDAGQMLLSHVQDGAVFIPTRITLGSGKMPDGKTVESMTNVVTPVLDLEITRQERMPDGGVIFGSTYQNTQVTADFYWRELALYARAEYRDIDGTTTVMVPECLYIYGNFGDTADLIPAYAAGDIMERSVDLVVDVGGNEEKVELSVKSGIYVTLDEMKIYVKEHSISSEDLAGMITPITHAQIAALFGT